MIRRRVLLRCDGGDLPEIGTGHVVRCLAMAHDLAELPGSAVAFCMRTGREALRVQAAGFEVFAIEAGQDPNTVLLEAAAEHDADVVALDDLGASAPAVAPLRAAGPYGHASGIRTVIRMTGWKPRSSSKRTRAKSGMLNSYSPSAATGELGLLA